MSSEPKDDQRVSLHGLTPEEALRALLAVDPDDPEAEDAQTKKDPAHKGPGE